MSKLLGLLWGPYIIITLRILALTRTIISRSLPSSVRMRPSRTTLPFSRIAAKAATDPAGIVQLAGLGFRV